MGKGRDKRKRKTKDAAAKVRAEVTAAYEEAERALKKRHDPPNPIAPEAPVPAPLKPKPHLRSGAIALPEPDASNDALEALPRRMSE